MITGGVAKDEYFYAKSDERTIVKILKNLDELYDFLRTCSSDVIKFHLRNGKNDFARWIRDSMYLYDLAQDIFFIDHKGDHKIFRNKRQY